MLLARMADAEATETQVSIHFAHDCGDLSINSRDELSLAYEEIGKMLGGILSKPDRFVAEAKR